MGIRLACPNGHKLHVKEQLAGKRAICPECGAKFVIPALQDSPQAALETPTSPRPPVANPVANPVSQGPTDQQAEPIDTPLPPAIASDLQPPEIELQDVELPKADPIALRQRSKKRQLMTILLLLLATLVLACVLVWILTRAPDQAGGYWRIYLNQTHLVVETLR